MTNDFKSISISKKNLMKEKQNLISFKFMTFLWEKRPFLQQINVRYVVTVHFRADDGGGCSNLSTRVSSEQTPTMNFVVTRVIVLDTNRKHSHIMQTKPSKRIFGLISSGNWIDVENLIKDCLNKSFKVINKNKEDRNQEFIWNEYNRFFLI